MRRLWLCTIAFSLSAAASAPVEPPATPLDAQLQQARLEQAAAEARVARLESASAEAQGNAARLRISEAAAAAAIEASEARITAADTQLRLIAASLDARRQRFAREQQPIAVLLAGLATMAERPPLLAIADRGSADDFVQVQLLIRSTLPRIRLRTAQLSTELRGQERLQKEVEGAKAEALQSREQLIERRQRLAQLERQAFDLAQSSGAQALATGDIALAAGEDVEQLGGEAKASRAASAAADRLADLAPAPQRPVPPERDAAVTALQYRLPGLAPLMTGFGAVNASGVRSRGVTLATVRGAPLVAPAAGVVRFSGAFRDYDGLLIIDHGHGWLSVILNAASQLKPGDRVAFGEPVGRALGPIEVELSQNGQRMSPALIAGSSPALSNGGKGG